MSGGHWGYRSHKLQEQGQEFQGLFALLAEVEHELDWGICCDTCLGCAKNRVAEAFIRYFDGDFEAARAIMVDRSQFKCERCRG